MKLKEPIKVTDIHINLRLRYIDFLIDEEVVAAFPLDQEPLTAADEAVATWRKKRQIKVPQRPLSYYDDLLKSPTSKKGGGGV